MNIADYIPFGRENAISRMELKELLKIDDRQIRLLIKEENRRALENDFAILSSSSARGYWKSKDVFEIKAYLKESERRRRTEIENNFYIMKLIDRKVV